MAQLGNTVVAGSLRVVGDSYTNNLSSTLQNNILIGTGIAQQDKGSGVSPRYFPVRWYFNLGISTPQDGDTVTIKVPCNGHDWGDFLSLDNGTTYKPIGLKTQDNGRLTNHFGAGKIITMTYDSAAVVESVFAATGGDTRTNITGAWKVTTSYLDGNSNTYDRNRNTGVIKCGTTAIVAGNVIVGKDGVYHHLKDGTPFDITYPILYAAGALAAGATGDNNYDILLFDITTTQSMTLTAHLPVYIRGSLSKTIFTPVNSTPLTQTANVEGAVYILLGRASTGGKNIYITEHHPIFLYRNGALCPYAAYAQDAVTIKGLSISLVT